MDEGHEKAELSIDSVLCFLWEGLNIRSAQSSDGVEQFYSSGDANSQEQNIFFLQGDAY